MADRKKILDVIGNTPLLPLGEDLTGGRFNLFVKLEYLNPSGSIKDRIALHMIEKAEEKGIIKPGDTIVEASTGNTAIAFSFVGRVKGYKIKIFMPAEVGEDEKIKTMNLYGAEVVMVETGAKAAGDDASIHGGNIEVLPRQRCLDMERANEGVWWARQFINPDNSGAHRETTGKEIIEQTGGNVDAFVASIGTAGTLVGVGQILREANPNVKIIGVEPAGFPWIQKGRESINVIEGIAGGLLLDAVDMVDEVYVIKNDEAVEMANQLVNKKGFFCGISSGANVLAAMRLAEKHPELKNIVTVLPDRRDRYFTVQRYTT